MPLTNAGRDFITDAIMNAGPPTFFTNANSYLGVGDSATAFNATQTDLVAATNKLRDAMEASYPSQPTANQLAYRSLFSTAQANFVWAEWAVFNASSAGTMLTRKVEALGTKTSAQQWQLTVTLTVNNP